MLLEKEMKRHGFPPNQNFWVIRTYRGDKIFIISILWITNIVSLNTIELSSGIQLYKAWALCYSPIILATQEAKLGGL